jgi:Spy/CpxP family protein refolding chaperone
MKTQKLIAPVLLIALFFATSAIMAQPRTFNDQNPDKPQHFRNLDLNDEQQDKVDVFFTEMQKQINPIKADLDEKEAQLNKLMIADKPDNQAIVAKVKEIGDLKTKIQIAGVENRMKVRSILDENQKTRFDAMEMNDGPRKGGKQGRGQRGTGFGPEGDGPKADGNGPYGAGRGPNSGNCIYR